MTRVGIVTDSTADVPGDLASELDIAVVPAQVYIGSEAYSDGIGLSHEEFYAKVASSKELLRTSQPPVGQFAETYQRLLEAGQCDSVLSIHIAGTLSGTVNAAWAAAQMQPDPSRVEVIDTGQLSMGAGWAVIKAARLVKNGDSRKEISQAVRAILPRLRVAAVIDTLENLYRGGRISLVSVTLGTILRIKPLLSIRNGEVTVLGQLRTRARALQRLVEIVQAWGSLDEMAVLHTGAEELALQLTQRLRDRAPAHGALTAAAGPALATHLGVGAVGVCALADPRG
jgi:DegV family protein with EDD domain